jgi:hypothetical protein
LLSQRTQAQRSHFQTNSIYDPKFVTVLYTNYRDHNQC